MYEDMQQAKTILIIYALTCLPNMRVIDAGLDKIILCACICVEKDGCVHLRLDVPAEHESHRRRFGQDYFMCMCMCGVYMVQAKKQLVFAS
jgi:hypothetical protein